MGSTNSQIQFLLDEQSTLQYSLCMGNSLVKHTDQKQLFWQLSMVLRQYSSLICTDALVMTGPLSPSAGCTCSECMSSAVFQSSSFTDWSTYRYGQANVFQVNQCEID